jgi:hypothetical protein
MKRSNKTNSRIYSRTFTNGDIKTETKDSPMALHVDIESTRFGKEGTTATIGFDNAPNRFLRLNGRELRSLYQALDKHYAQFVYAD